MTSSMTTGPGSAWLKCASAAPALHAPAPNRTTIVTAWIAGCAGISAHATRPAMDPKVPGATGTYPMPRAVASASATTFTRETDGGHQDGRPLGVRVDDTRAGRAIVQASPVWVEQDAQESETRRCRKDHPKQCPKEGLTDARGASVLRRHNPNAGRDLAKGLPGCGKRGQVSTVLDDEVHEERTLRQEMPLRQLQSANLHRQIHDNDIRGREDDDVYEHCQQSIGQR